MTAAAARTASGRRRTVWLPVAALLLLHVGMALGAVRGKSVTFDELAHVTAGYSYWITGDYRLHPQNGLLPQRLAGLALLSSRPRFPSLDQPAWWTSNEFAMGHHFFYGESNDADAMLWRARCTMVLLSLGLGILVYAWARRLFGPGAGLAALTLYAFSPTMLAHGPLATSDIAAALFFSAATWALWTLLGRVSPATLAAGAAATAGLFLAKLSAVLIVPVVVILAVLRLLSAEPLTVALGSERRIAGRLQRARVLVGAGLAQVLVVGTIIWGCYGFRYDALRHAVPGRDTLRWETVTHVPAVIRGAVAMRALPEAYLFGIASVRHHATVRRAFLNGRHSWRGWWWFFPYCLAVKTSPVLLVLLLAGAVLAIPRTRTSAGRRELAVLAHRTAPLWVLLAVYWAAAIASGLNVGHRHLLPTYPPMFILAGGAAAALARHGRVSAAGVVAGLGLHIVGALVQWPHYLAYFNGLAGGSREGYRHLVDSSLDWGQDLPGLRSWVDRQRAAEKTAGDDVAPVYLSYFGSGSPEYYGIDAKAGVRRLPGYYDHWRRKAWYPLTGGIYCISATMLESVYAFFTGPWAAPYERLYQDMLATMRREGIDPQAQEKPGATFLNQHFAVFEQLRLARLLAFLRQREPDGDVGHSILIYRLTDEDVAQALFGPPAELVPTIEVPGIDWGGYDRLLGLEG